MTKTTKLQLPLDAIGLSLFRSNYRKAMAALDTYLASTAGVLTAHSGGGKGAALSLTAAINEVTVVAAANDSVLLKPALSGARQSVTNSGANAMQVFGQGTDVINGVATGTGISMAAGTTKHFVCATSGRWVG